MKPRLSFDLAEKVSFDGMLFVVSFSFLFLSKNARELHIIILRSEKGKEPKQHIPGQPKGMPTHSHQLTQNSLFLSQAHICFLSLD